jgi:hypothetical protein
VRTLRLGIAGPVRYHCSLKVVLGSVGFADQTFLVERNFSKMKKRHSRGKQAAKFSKRDLQPQKIFVERLPETNSIYNLERELAVFFAEFGSVIDVKVLSNGNLTRHWSVVCLCHFRQRRDCSRSTNKKGQVQVPRSVLISFLSHGHLLERSRMSVQNRYFPSPKTPPSFL